MMMLRVVLLEAQDQRREDQDCHPGQCHISASDKSPSLSLRFPEPQKRISMAIIIFVRNLWQYQVARFQAD